MTARLKKLAAVLCMMLPCMAAATPPSEYEVKAAFIHNIAKFVEWPGALPSSGSARLCLAGGDPFAGALDALRGKQVGSLLWEIVPVNARSNLKACRVLFIAAAERDNLGGILAGIGTSPVLTMGDTDGYAARGVMVNFYLEEHKVRFEINHESAKRAGLGISSQLLKMVRIVGKAGGT